MKKGFFGAIIVSVLLSLLLCGCEKVKGSIKDMGSNASYYSYDNGELYESGNFMQTEEEITALSVDWIGGSVTVCEKDQPSITVSEDYVPEKNTTPYCVHTYADKKGTLYVKFMRYNLQVTTELPQKNVTVALPKGTSLTSLTLSVSTATAVLDGIKCDRAAHSSSGIKSSLTVKNCSIKDFSTDIALGNADFSDNEFETVRTVMGTGNASFSKDTAKNANIECKTGNLLLDGVTVTEKAECEVTMTGNLFIKSSFFEEIRASLATGNAVLADFLAKKTNLTCSTGNISVNLSADMTDYTLDAFSLHSVVMTDEFVRDKADNYVVGKGTYPMEFNTPSGKICFMSANEAEKLFPKKK